MECRKGDVVCATANFIQTKFGSYTRRKSYAQASIDVALLVVSATHLARVLRGDEPDNLRTLKIVLISLSIVLEVVIAILLFIKERYNFDDKNQNKVMDILNNIVLYVIFASSLVHVFVSVFVEDHSMPHFNRFVKYINQTGCGPT